MARNIVVVGGSAGALQPLMEMLRNVPSSIPASFFVVIHSSPDTPGMLVALLGKQSALTVAYAVDGARVEPGCVYVAPPDHHLLLEDGTMSITRGPRENGFRPAVDPLFRTAAAAHGGRVIGVVLSGGLDDGTRGLAAVKEAGGLAVVQQLDDVVATGMPSSAIRNVAVDHVVAAADLAPLLTRLIGAASLMKDRVMSEDHRPSDRAERGLHALERDGYPGSPSAFTCPECGGALWELEKDKLTRFACHVGHSYTPDTLATGMAATLEAALWTALRALEENSAFLRRMEERAAINGLEQIADGYGTKAKDVEARAEVVRSALVDDVSPEGAVPPPATPRPEEVA